MESIPTIAKAVEYFHTMESEEKNIFKRILDMSGLSLRQDTFREFNEKDERKKKILFVDDADPKARFWLNPDTGDIDNMKYDEIVITYENDENEEVVYGILLEYIRENSLYRICEEYGNGDPKVRFVIPSFSSLSELQIKLDMI